MNAVLNLRLTYAGVIARLAESDEAPSFSSARDLPELSLEELAAALRHYPSAFIEALCESDPVINGLCTDRLADTTQKTTERYAHVGLVIVGAIRAYVRGLVLRDVLALIERRREADSIEAGNDHGETLTADQQRACELGLGRTLRS